MQETKDGYFLHNGEKLVMRWYKEPMTELKPEEGFGFKGAIMQTHDGEKILCNECGLTFPHMGSHVNQKHKMTASEYKTKFGLKQESALVSDKLRLYYKNKTMAWLAGFTPEQKEAYFQKCRNRLSKARPLVKKRSYTMSLEQKNLRGTCPDQLIAKIKEVAKDLGKTPSKMEFARHLKTQRFTHKIYDTFGSWTKALEMAGMTPNSSVSNGGTIRHGEDELLAYLSIFAQEHNKIPTGTDFRNGFLPSQDTYKRRFGSIEAARQAAGVYDIVKPDKQFLLKRGNSIGVNLLQTKPLFSTTDH